MEDSPLVPLKKIAQLITVSINDDEPMDILEDFFDAKIIKTETEFIKKYKKHSGTFLVDTPWVYYTYKKKDGVIVKKHNKQNTNIFEITKDGKTHFLKVSRVNFKFALFSFDIAHALINKKLNDVKDTKSYFVKLEDVQVTNNKILIDDPYCFFNNKKKTCNLKIHRSSYDKEDHGGISGFETQMVVCVKTEFVEGKSFDYFKNIIKEVGPKLKIYLNAKSTLEEKKKGIILPLFESASSSKKKKELQTQVESKYKEFTELFKNKIKMFYGQVHAALLYTSGDDLKNDDGLQFRHTDLFLKNILMSKDNQIKIIDFDMSGILVNNESFKVEGESDDLTESLLKMKESVSGEKYQLKNDELIKLIEKSKKISTSNYLTKILTESFTKLKHLLKTFKDDYYQLNEDSIKKLIGDATERSEISKTVNLYQDIIDDFFDDNSLLKMKFIDEVGIYDVVPTWLTEITGKQFIKVLNYFLRAYNKLLVPDPLSPEKKVIYGSDRHYITRFNYINYGVINDLKTLTNEIIFGRTFAESYLFFNVHLMYNPFLKVNLPRKGFVNEYKSEKAKKLMMEFNSNTRLLKYFINMNEEDDLLRYIANIYNIDGFPTGVEYNKDKPESTLDNQHFLVILKYMYFYEKYFINKTKNKKEVKDNYELITNNNEFMNSLSCHGDYNYNNCYTVNQRMNSMILKTLKYALQKIGKYQQQHFESLVDEDVGKMFLHINSSMNIKAMELSIKMLEIINNSKYKLMIEHIKMFYIYCELNYKLRYTNFEVLDDKIVPIKYNLQKWFTYFDDDDDDEEEAEGEG